MATCACGKRMSKYVSQCKACNIARRLRQEKLVEETNKILKTKTVVRSTAFGPYIVDSISYSDLGVFIHTHPEGVRRDSFNERSFMIHFGDVENIKSQAAT